MDLIKKSASVTENEYKNLIARITILFLKELKLLHHWYKYTSTDKYHESVREYLRQNKSRTEAWNDRDDCMKVLGMCSFGDYLKTKGAYLDTYNLYAAFLAIFCVEEYHNWAVRMGEKDTPEEFIQRVSRLGKKYNDLIDSWFKLKKIL